MECKAFIPDSSTRQDSPLCGFVLFVSDCMLSLCTTAGIIRDRQKCVLLLILLVHRHLLLFVCSYVSLNPQITSLTTKLKKRGLDTFNEETGTLLIISRYFLKLLQY
jgi:hypothetical protein